MQYRFFALAALLIVAASGVAPGQDNPANEAESDATATPAPPSVPEKVARVGDRVITGEDFLRDMNQRLLRLRMEAGADYQPEPDFQRQVLMERVERELLQIVAEASAIRIDEADVQREFARGRGGFASDEDYADYLEALGTTEERLLREIGKRLLREAYVARETADIEVTEEELREQYEEVREQGGVYRRKKTADFVHIFVRSPGPDVADWGLARERIDAMRARILAGESMEELARELSDDPLSAPRDGMYYEARKEDVPEPLAEQLFSIPLDQVSDPIRSNVGWHLIKVVALHNPGTVSFEQLEPMLRKGVLSAKKAVRIAEILAEARGRIPVDIYTAEGEPIPLPPPTMAEEPEPEEASAD